MMLSLHAFFASVYKTKRESGLEEAFLIRVWGPTSTSLIRIENVR